MTKLVQKMNPAILIVDDEQSICAALQRTFRKEKFHVFSANSGKQALEILDKNSIDVIVSDQRMPGMTGTQLLSIVKDSHPNIGRIILSGHSDANDLVDAINEANIYQFLPKPWQDDKLISTVNKAIKNPYLVPKGDTLPRHPHILPSLQVPDNYRPSYAIHSLINDNYLINLEKDIKNDQLILSENTYESTKEPAESVKTYHVEWPKFSNFSHSGIINMASQSGYVNELFTWYLVKVNESLADIDNSPELKIIDLFFDNFPNNRSVRVLLSKLLSIQSKLIFRMPFELLQKNYLNDFLRELYQSNHSLSLDIGKRVIDLKDIDSSYIRYIEMDAKYSSINNHLLTEKRLVMLQNAQNMDIKTILSKSDSVIQRNYALSMGFDYF